MSSVERIGHFVVYRDATGIKEAVRATTVLGLKEDPDTGMVVMVTRMGTSVIDAPFDEALEAVWR